MNQEATAAWSDWLVDMQSGASLVVRCIAGGRQAANNADRYLMGTN